MEEDCGEEDWASILLRCAGCNKDVSPSGWTTGPNLYQSLCRNCRDEWKKGIMCDDDCSRYLRFVRVKNPRRCCVCMCTQHGTSRFLRIPSGETLCESHFNQFKKGTLKWTDLEALNEDEEASEVGSESEFLRIQEDRLRIAHSMFKLEPDSKKRKTRTEFENTDNTVTKSDSTAPIVIDLTVDCDTQDPAVRLKDFTSQKNPRSSRGSAVSTADCTAQKNPDAEQNPEECRNRGNPGVEELQIKGADDNRAELETVISAETTQKDFGTDERYFRVLSGSDGARHWWKTEYEEALKLYNVKQLSILQSACVARYLSRGTIDIERAEEVARKHDWYKTGFIDVLLFHSITEELRLFKRM